MISQAPFEGALHILERALASLVGAARPGVTPLDLARLASALINDAGAVPILPSQTNDRGEPFDFAACVCVNAAAANAVPTPNPLAPGDLVTIDVALALPADPVFAVVDGATTCVVPGIPVPAAQSRLLEAARATIRACIASARPGATPATLRAAAAPVARAFGCSLASIALVHRVSQSPGPLHVPIPEHAPLQAGDVIAIEPLVIDADDPTLRLSPDGFTLHTARGSLAAYEEATIRVGDDDAAPALLPPADFRRWLI